MLVLSRRLGEKVVLPGLQTTVQVVSIKSAVVRLGIEAPPEIGVFREELLDGTEPARGKGSAPSTNLQQLNHRMRNHLNAATVGLALLRRQCQAGQAQAAEGTLARIEEEVQLLRQQVDNGAGQSKPTAPSPRPHRALLVEDDHNERELLAGLLRMAGLEVTTAGDGVAALNYLDSQGQPDVVLLDMALPVCDGPTTVRTIRRDPAYNRLKIFAISGYPPDQFNLNGDGTGVDRWFRKPLNPESLLRELQRDLAEAL